MSVFHHVKDFLSKTQSTDLQKSSSPNIVCTRLEPHWRSNKSLPSPFSVLLLTAVADGTIVSVAAGNDDSPCGEVRNETTKVARQVARFNDLRFVGKSGRGKNFHLTITVHSKPMMVAVVPRAIKVTVDGPRDARAPKAVESRKRAFPTYGSYSGIPMPAAMPLPPLPMMPIFHPVILQQTYQTLHRSMMASHMTSCPDPHIEDLSPDRGQVSLTQTTPQSSDAKRRRKASDSSASSSPTIWRPF